MAKQNINIDNIRHSLAHLLAAAVLQQFPKAKLGIGPVIENGFYYDFLLPRSLTPDDLKRFEATMRQFIKDRLSFSGKKVTVVQAKNQFKGQRFKLDLIKEFSKDKKPLTVYKTGNVFLDLCRGGHVKNTSEINPDAFKLDKIAGAYWRGNEKNPQLQRIYGLAFETKKELDEYSAMMEEAKKRDHKKLGQELDLFTFSELVGSGLPLWTPKGTIIRNLLDDFVWLLRKERGYQKVEIPHITKKDLYEISGHWAKFNNELFKIVTREGHLFAMKPMNCPHHTQIYKRRLWSYRDLPQRYANTTMCYRDEQTGELAGLSRARSFTQDDAHVFCRQDQIIEEMDKIWEIIKKFYTAVGFDDLEIRLSLHDPKQLEKYLGTSKLWKLMEGQLRGLVKKRGVKAVEAVGEAAFYGPKIDFLAKDSLRREWQVATIQLDMNLPERFDLTCVNEGGKPERIVMIHAAIMGSIERFLSIVIEHYAGALPFWLAPVQVKIIPIADRHLDYAQEVAKSLVDFRVEIANESETVGKKIRNAELQKIPYLLVVGDVERDNKTIRARERQGGDLGEMSVEDFIKKVK
ncbi:MAG: threonine--tRNA ligase [bacterium]|nr:threonine--tRNA ligase [bacterium]